MKRAQPLALLFPLLPLFSLSSLFSLFPLLTACQASHRVYHHSVAPDDAQGIYYALPRKALIVDLEIQRQREIHGICEAETALRIELGLEVASDPPPRRRRSQTESATVQNALSLAPGPFSLSLHASLRERIEVDPLEIYLVDLRGRALESFEGVFELSPEGLLSSASITVENRGLDIALAASSAVVDIASIALGATFAGDSRQSSCERYANRIKELRSQRKSIFGGTWQGLVGGIPRDSLDRILTGLDRQENALLALFTATTETLTETLSCTVVPYPLANPGTSSQGSLVFPLVHIDRQSGQVSLADPNIRCTIPTELQGNALMPAASRPGPPAAQGATVQGSLSTAYLTLNLDPYGIAAQVAGEAMSYCTEQQEGRCTAPQGLFYRIPRQVEASVWWVPGKVEVLTQRDLLIPQLGITAALPSKSGGQRSQQAIVLDPETGALKVFARDSETISRKQIDQFADDAVKLYDSAHSSRHRDKELERLQRERAILEEAVRIQDAQEKLGGSSVGGSPGDQTGGSSGGSGSTPRPSRGSPANRDSIPPNRPDGSPNRISP